ncbi:heavy metal-associated isoprenylated plant protein 47-like [Rosa rugosa]|uniref:heavy metal-associated isoprenylated plant protein 47-like n=1 Tax=Rosa rugosa TaxID=74645 RepID=UPI002B4134B0|nr:heavy metal-associated isoprenylated plant protein 47-like [Rosa rugosa]
MKQKITIEANIWCDKCRSKAMKIAVVEDGVKSVAFKEARSDQIEIIGDDVDAAGLTRLLRKKLGYANLLSLEEITEKKTSQDAQNTNSYSPIRGRRCCHHHEMELHIYDPPSGGCTIM